MTAVRILRVALTAVAGLLIAAFLLFAFAYTVDGDFRFALAAIGAGLGAYTLLEPIGQPPREVPS